MERQRIYMGYTAAEARARGEDVPPEVADEAGAYHYGWGEPTVTLVDGVMRVTMPLIEPHWYCVTIEMTIAT